MYEYLVGCIGLFLIWLILFILRKDLRKEILIVSLIFGFGGLIVDPIYSSDWWFPSTITGTMPGIESFIFGFTVGGIASAIYLEIFREKLRHRRIARKKLRALEINHFLVITLAGILFFLSFFIFNLNSYYASFPALLIPIGTIWILRKDLIFESFMSGLLLTIVSFIFYFIPEFIFPGWIESTWNFNLISGNLILGVPIEDLIWFFMAGMFIGPIYEFVEEAKISKK